MFNLRLFLRALALCSITLIGWNCSTTTFISKTCVKSVGMPGPEDFEMDNLYRRILVSSQDRRKRDPDGEFAEPGQIFQIPLNGAALGTPAALPLTERDGLPFHPHGMALVQSQNIQTLYVINHAMFKNHSIEVFEVRPGELRFLRRLRSPLLISPNDVAAMPNGELYVTNDHGRKGFMQVMEDVFAMRWSNVVHMKDGRWEIVADGFSVANGVAVSEKGDAVYVAATRDRGVHVFKRDPQSGTLTFGSFINIKSGVDNLLWEKPTVLNVAAHPSILDFLSHYGDAQKPSPSEVYRIKTDTGEFSLIYSDDGRQLSASSTALVVNNRLYVSQVFEPFIISCGM